MSDRRLLTLDDLYTYYSTHSRSVHFSSADSGYPIVVQVPAILSFNESNEATEGLLPVVLQSCHIGKNINQTIIKEDVMKKALPSFCNRPILGYIHKVGGQWEFYTHNMHVGEDGEIEYDEVPIGIVPESCNAMLEYDEEKGRTYVVVNGYIFEEYSRAADILRRERECSVSVELSIRKLSYDAKERCLSIEDMYFSGVTILGKDPDGKTILPGMAGSNIKLADFSAKNNSLFSNKIEAQMIEMQDKIDKIISCFNIDIKNSKKGGISMSHFEELLSKYDKTLKDISFDHENLSDEELDIKFEEEFGGTSAGDNSSGVTSTDNNTDEGSAGENGEDTQNHEDATNTENTDTFSRKYELSHDDIRYALYNLLAPVEKADDTSYCIVEVFDDFFVYSDWYSSSKVYGQAYIKNEDSVAFVGERYDLFVEYLTASEKESLDSMRSNYETISARLKAYEEADIENKKIELLNSEDYTTVKNTKEFDKLVKNHANISYEDLQSRCDQILLNEVKSGRYAANNPSVSSSEVSKKQFANPKVIKKKPSRYGNLFKKKEE